MIVVNRLCSALEPSSLNRAIYPLLASFTTPDVQAYPRHSLSRAALITSESPIFFLDAFTTLIVFYSSTADSTLPFPPPQDCKLLCCALLFHFCKFLIKTYQANWISCLGLLRTVINKLKQERSITPKLIFIRGGQDDATLFENYLIEEQDVDGSGFTSMMGLLSFLDEIKHSVLEYMKY